MKKILVICAALAMSVCAFAQENSNGEKPAASANMETLELVNQLVQYGYEHYSATALVQAIELYTTVSTTKGNEAKTTEGEAVDTAKDQKFTLDVTAILAQAREFADGDATILAYIAQVENNSKASTTLGRVGGPSTTEECVLARDTDVYRVRFYGGEKADVLVCGDGDTDLDLYIYDENGNEIDKDTDTTDLCYCSWTPKWTGYFTIKIRNYGDVRNYYTMYIE